MAYTGKLKPDAVWTIIGELGRQFGEVAGTTDKNPRKLFGRIAWRREHFLRLPAADPPLPEHLKNSQKFQSDAPRRVHVKMKFRMTENHFMIKCQPLNKSASARSQSDEASKFFNSGLLLAEQNLMDQPIQAALSDGQLIDCYAVLHWCMADHIWPSVPEPAFLDPDEYAGLDPDEKKNYEPAEEDEGKPQRRYKTTARARLNQRKVGKAVAGFPWWVEVLYADVLMWERDRSMDAGFSKVVVRRTVPLHKYVQDLKAENGGPDDAVSAYDVNHNLPDYTPRDAPNIAWEPNAAEWGTTVDLYQVWTRDECYEVIAGKSGAMYKVTKCISHPYGQPPFSLAEAVMGPGNDPVHKYQPGMEGVFRTKVVFDRGMTYLMVIAEESALPYVYWRNVKTGEFFNGEDGSPKAFRKDSAQATKAPAGWEIAKLEYEINPAYVSTVEFLKNEVIESEPDSGNAEVGASSTPWAIRLQQAQANIEPAAYIYSQARAIERMVRNMMYVHGLSAEEGGFGEVAYTYAAVQSKAGGGLEIDTQNIVSLDPAWVKSLLVQVTISSVSGQERIAKIEHGRSLLNDPKVPMTQRTFLEEYMDDPDPYRTLVDWHATMEFESKVLPGLLDQAMSARYGPRIILGPNFQGIDMTGAPVSSADVLRRNGYNVPPTPQELAAQGGPGPAAAPGPGMAPGGPPMPGAGPQLTSRGQPFGPAARGSQLMQFHAPQVKMGSLPGLYAPNTTPLAGMPS